EGDAGGGGVRRGGRRGGRDRGDAGGGRLGGGSRGGRGAARGRREHRGDLAGDAQHVVHAADRGSGHTAAGPDGEQVDGDHPRDRDRDVAVLAGAAEGGPVERGDVGGAPAVAVGLGVEEHEHERAVARGEVDAVGRDVAVGGGAVEAGSDRRLEDRHSRDLAYAVPEVEERGPRPRGGGG